MPTFNPPEVWERMPTRVRPFSFFNTLTSRSVVRRNGHYQSVRVISQEESDALVEGETWFCGGHAYTISDDLAMLLEADGYPVYPGGGGGGGGGGGDLLLGFGEGGYGEGGYGA